MFSKAKRKNDQANLEFEPNGCLSAYLVAQLYFVMIAFGGFIILLASGALLTQPILFVWLMITFVVGILTWQSIIGMWHGERKGYYGLIISYTLFFLYFLAFTYVFQQSGIPYLILIVVDMALLVIMIHPRRHLLASS